jgi:hypothetical protein
LRHGSAGLWKPIRPFGSSAGFSIICRNTWAIALICSSCICTDSASFAICSTSSPAHAARFNYDLDAIFRDIKEQEKKSGRKFFSFPPGNIEPNKALKPTGPAPAVSDNAPSQQAGPAAER